MNSPQINKKYNINIQPDASSELYHKTIYHYFRETIFNGLMSLPYEDRANVFVMMTTHNDVLCKLLPVGSHPLLEHIQGIPWTTANNAVANNSSIIIDYDYPQPLLTAYDEWKANTAT